MEGSAVEGSAVDIGCRAKPLGPRVPLPRTLDCACVHAAIFRNKQTVTPTRSKVFVADIVSTTIFCT